MNRFSLPVAGLLTLAFVPVGGSLFRLFDVALRSATPESARFHDAPLAVVLHASGAVIFLVFGALQFRPARGAWHRQAGKVALCAGLIAALAGLWMTLTYPNEPANPPLLQAVRLMIGTFWVHALCSAFVAIRHRDFAAHRAWMFRAYAVGAGAGTAVVFIPIFGLTAGQAVAWTVNLIVAETLIRKKGAIA